jgi:hypothetical protein
MATIELEKKIVTEAEVAKLWEAFKVFDADGSIAILTELRTRYILMYLRKIKFLLISKKLK